MCAFFGRAPEVVSAAVITQTLEEKLPNRKSRTEKNRPRIFTRGRGDESSCRYSLLRPQKVLAFKVLAEFVVPVLAERVLFREPFEFLRDRQRPALVAVSSEFLETRHRVDELRLVIGAVQRESLFLRVLVEVRSPYELMTVERDHAYAEIKPCDVGMRIDELGLQPDDADRDRLVRLLEFSDARHGRVGEAEVLLPLADLHVTA